MNGEQLELVNRKRMINLVRMIKVLGSSELGAHDVRDLFICLIQMNKLDDRLLDFGLTFVPQQGEYAGKIFHFATNASIEGASVSRIIHSASAIFRNNTQEPIALKNFLGVELNRLSGRSIGYAWVVSVAEADEVDQTYLRIIAQYIETTVIEKKRSKALSSIIKHSSTSVDSDSITDKGLIDGVTEAAHADFVIVWRFDESTKFLKPVRMTRDANLLIKLGEGVAGHVALRRQVETIDDFQDSNELRENGIPGVKHTAFLEKNKLSSGMFLPIEVEGKLNSLLGVYFSRRRGITHLESSICRHFASLYAASRRNLQDRKSSKFKAEDLSRLASFVGIARHAKELIHDSSKLLTGADNHLVF